WPDRGEALRLRVGQGTKQDAPHDAEHRGVRADAECERRQRDHGERAVFASLAERDGQITTNRLPQLPCHLILGRWRAGAMRSVLSRRWTSFAVQTLGFL